MHFDWIPVLIQKDTETKGDMPNVGREPASYLWAIIQMYDSIEPNDRFAFVQGDPLPHCLDFPAALDKPVAGFKPLGGGVTVTLTYKDGNSVILKEPFTSDANGGPSHEGIPVGGWYERWLNRDFPGEIQFWPGCQFMCTGRELLRYSVEWYRAVLNDLMTVDHACYAFERLAPAIFSNKRKGF